MRLLSNYILLSILCFLLVSCAPTKKNIQTNSTTSENKYFEGQITYELTYAPKTANLTKEQAVIFFGDIQVYTIKGDKYKNEMNGKLKMSQYYLGNDTLFITTTQSNELLWVDATRLNDEVLKKELSRNVEIINGITCDLLTITSEKGSFKYYFNSSFKINEQYFKNHKVGFWDICTAETKSLMLKSILDTENEYIELVATDIQNKTVDETAFDLPNYERKRFPIKYKK